MRTASVIVRSREVPPRQDAVGRSPTPREEEVLRLIMLGKANKEIASVVNISERTVKFHMTHLFEKFGVTTRMELLALLSSVKSADRS